MPHGREASDRLDARWHGAFHRTDRFTFARGWYSGAVVGSSRQKKLSPIFLPLGVAGSPVVPKERVVLLTCERLMVARDPATRSSGSSYRRSAITGARCQSTAVLNCREGVRPLKVKKYHASEIGSIPDP